MDTISLLKTAADGQIFSSSRYNADQTAVENAINKIISSVTDGDSGADHIKATPISTVSVSANTVQGIMEAIVSWLVNEVQTILLGQITDGTVTYAKLDDTLKDKIDTLYMTDSVTDIQYKLIIEDGVLKIEEV